MWLVCAGRRHAVRASTLRPLPHACVPPPQTSLSPTFRSFLPPGPRPASPAAHNRPRARLCSSLRDLCCPLEGVTRPRPTPTARVSHPRLLSKAPLFVITPPAPTNRALPPGRTQPPPTAVAWTEEQVREGRWSGRRAGQLARVLWASLCLSPAAPLPRDGGGSLGCAGEVTMILDNVSRTCATS